jgi:DNA primase
MREPSATDFTIPLPDVGDFVYARRTIGDMMKIRVVYLRYLQGEDEEADKELSFFAGITAAHSVLCVSCPAGWEDLTALDDSKGLQVVELSNLLTEKEDSFRVAAKVASKA